jgi:hypothetical protein
MACLEVPRWTRLCVVSAGAPSALIRTSLSDSEPNAWLSLYTGSEQPKRATRAPTCGDNPRMTLEAHMGHKSDTRSMAV